MAGLFARSLLLYFLSLIEWRSLIAYSLARLLNILTFPISPVLSFALVAARLSSQRRQPLYSAGGEYTARERVRFSGMISAALSHMLDIRLAFG